VNQRLPHRSKIKLSGRLSGKRRSRKPIRRSRALTVFVFCLVRLRDQGIQNGTVIHGQEKVYGSRLLFACATPTSRSSGAGSLA
jgi:hypothetical protein